MVDQFSLTIPGAPVPMERARVVRRGNFVRSFTPPRSAEYKKIVGTAALAARPSDWDLTSLIEIEALFVLPDRRRRDLDNLLKAILDGANKILFADDSQVVSIHAHKRVDATSPRVELTLRALPAEVVSKRSRRAA